MFIGPNLKELLNMHKYEPALPLKTTQYPKGMFTLRNRQVNCESYASRGNQMYI
jgi:hypothetical protein